MPFESLKVPDLWFDAIARTTPGACFWLALNEYHNLRLFNSDGAGVVTVAFIGYATGLISASGASLITQRIEDTHFDEGKIDSIRSRLGRTAHQSRVLSKTHGETVAFINFAILAVIFAIMTFKGSTRLTGCPAHDALIAVLFAGICVLAALSSASRRLTRARKYEKDLKQQPASFDPNT